MDGATTTAIALAVGLPCAALCIVVWLLVSRFCGGRARNIIEQDNVVLFVHRTGEGSTTWEPFVIAPATPAAPPADPCNCSEEVQRALAAHRAEEHGPHTHADFATRAQQDALGRDLQMQITGLHNEQDRLRRQFRNLRLRVASSYPWDVVGAILGGIIGAIVAFSWSSDAYSYPTRTIVTVNGNSANVRNVMVENHWVLGGIILTGAFIGFLVGRVACWWLGRTQVVAEAAY